MEVVVWVSLPAPKTPSDDINLTEILSSEGDYLDERREIFYYREGRMKYNTF